MQLHIATAETVTIVMANRLKLASALLVAFAIVDLFHVLYRALVTCGLTTARAFIADVRFGFVAESAYAHDRAHIGSRERERWIDKAFE